MDFLNAHNYDVPFESGTSSSDDVDIDALTASIDAEIAKIEQQEKDNEARVIEIQ